MRFYELTLTSPTSGKVLRQWSSFPGGKFDPGALNVLFDAPVSVGAVPSTGAQTITVEGISLADLTNAQQFASVVEDGAVVGGASLTLKGGMGKGLPLANPAQQGLLVQGYVFQSWGTWVGTDMSISLLIAPGTYSNASPGNIVFQWSKGQPLGPAIQAALSTAFPNVPTTIQISPNRIAPRDDMGFYQTFAQLSQHIQQMTFQQLATSDQGVQMTSQSGAIRVFDGTQSAQTSALKQLKIFDFIGQPAWIQYDTIQVKTVLRGDIQVGDSVQFPQGFQSQPGAVQTAPGAYPAGAKYQSAIQGTFTVTAMRHIGNFRDPDGGSWATILNCVVNVQA